jgi:hypothetical protein
MQQSIISPQVGVWSLKKLNIPFLNPIVNDHLIVLILAKKIQIKEA